MTHTLRALAFGLALAFTLTACDSGTDTPDGAVAASGTLDNNFGAPVEGATMTFTSGAARGSASMPTYTTTSGANGAFNLNIPPGTYTLTVAHPNYGTTTTTVTVSAGGQVTIQTPVTGPGIFETLVVNALNGQSIPNASIACYTGTTMTGEAAFTATSDANGNVRVTGTPYGALQCSVTAPGLPTQTFGITIAATGTTTVPPVTVVPLPGVGEYRVVLTWGQTPFDLDSHVTGPDGSGGRFHVYYANASFGNTTLDLDDTSGSGPETITVSAASAAQGEYLYSVHNFSDQSTTGSQGIASSPTTVRVFGPQGLLRTYVAPAATPGNTWRVFGLVVSGTTATLNDNCPASQAPNVPCAGRSYLTATNSGDMGTFLTGEPGGSVVEKIAL